jgi:hypothetical protein
VSPPSPKGRAEREQKPNGKGDKKMIKKAIACLLLVMLAMVIPGLQLANAQMHHITGTDYTYSESYNSIPQWSAYPCYSECNHDVWPGDPTNTEAGMGVSAQYIHYTPAKFNYAWWDFNTEFGDGNAGDNVAAWSSVTIDPCVNGNDHHYYSYTPTFLRTYVTGDGWQYWCFYAHYEITQDPVHHMPILIDPASSVEGQCWSGFYHPSDPPWMPYFGQIWWLNCQTQNPANHPDGNGWSFLTAK